MEQDQLDVHRIMENRYWTLYIFPLFEITCQSKKLKGKHFSKFKGVVFFALMKIVN